MLNNSNFVLALHSIQNDLAQLENQLLKFKIVTGQSSFLVSSSHVQMSTQIFSQIQLIKASFASFCGKYEEQFKNVYNRLSHLLQRNTGEIVNKNWCEDQKYLIVTQKINVLEKSLKRTQQNQNKLIQAINLLMTKYEISDQPTMIENDEYLKSRIISSQASSIITFQPCSGGIRRVIDKQQSSKQKLAHTIKRTQQSVYLLKDNNLNSQTQNYGEPNYLKKISSATHGLKISLKHTGGGIQQLKNPYNSTKNFNSSYDLKDKRASSLNSHEHRFKFMMDNLNY